MDSSRLYWGQDAGRDFSPAHWPPCKLRAPNTSQPCRTLLSMPHPSEICLTLLSTPGPLSSAAPFGATPHPSELRRTLLSTPHPSEICLTLLSTPGPLSSAAPFCVRHIYSKLIRSATVRHEKEINKEEKGTLLHTTFCNMKKRRNWIFPTLIRSSQKVTHKYFANKILVSLAQPCAKFLVIYDWK